MPTLLAGYLDAEVRRDVIAHLARPKGIRDIDGPEPLVVPSLIKQVAPFDAMVELGWKPKFPKLLDIVSSAWDWHKAHPHGYPD